MKTAHNKAVRKRSWLVWGVVALLSLVFVFVRIPAGAQTTRGKVPAAPPPLFRKAVNFAETIPLRDMPADTGVYDKARSMRSERAKVEVGETNVRAIRTIEPGVVPDVDGALSLQNHGIAPQVLPPPTLVFDGVSNADNAALFGFHVSPPDTNGDVGPNHYVQVVNLALRVFNKSGAPAGPAVKFSTIFAALGTPASLRDDGDPIALYDPMADRWMLSQFAFPTGTGTPPYHQLIAVSKTPDPLGVYYLYDFIVSDGNNEFNDYPHFGVWPDGYYMSTNQFLNGGSFDGGGVFAFDRVKMLAGDPNAGFVYFNRNLASFPEGQAGMLPADMDGVRPPPMGAPCPFAYFTATEFGDPIDGMRIFDFRADFERPPNSTFTERPESAAIPGGGIPVAPFNPLAPPGKDAVPQPSPASNTTARLDAVADRLMHRLQYINFGTHESLVVNHTVNVGADQTLANYRAAVRYYQFRKNAGNNPYAVFEQGTHAPADTTHRWMGSAAMNAAGDLAVGFSASSTSVFPSIRYAARYAGDPAGSLAQGEQEIFTGSGVQTDPGSRWGDYSNLSLDPADDASFWFTTETYTAASQASSAVGWITKVAKFNVGGANIQFPKGMISGTITSCANGQPMSGAIVRTNHGFFTVTNANGNYTLPKMAPDTVTVTATKDGSAATANNVVVTNGNTTNVSLCVVPVNLIIQAGSGVFAAGPNGVLDPGETVTVSLAVQNVGGPGACTTALTGTLQPGGGVTSPVGPQNYGVTCAGSARVFRHFTFTVDPSLPCGSTVTASLTLTDGATSFGTFTYGFVVGSVATSLAENFDRVLAPALPEGWTTTFSGSGTAWTTSTLRPDTPPNSAFGTEATSVGLSEITSPAFAVSGGVKLTFRNQFNTEANYDGMVLEISIPSVNGGAFQDILAAGGSFESGGYNSTLDTGFSNPLPGRMAWSGLSRGTADAPAYITTEATLPAAAVGQDVRLKWRLGSDSSIAPATNPGVWIDSMSISRPVCGGSAPVPSSAVSRKTHGAAGDFSIPLPLTGAIGIEPRTGPAHTVVVTFPTPVTLSNVFVTGNGTATFSVAGSIITINLTGVADVQRLAITLTDVSDGSNVGNVIVPMGILAGDVVPNGLVGSSDIGQTKAFAQSGVVTASSFRADVTSSGVINASDIGFVKAKSGNTLP